MLQIGPIVARFIGQMAGRNTVAFASGVTKGAGQAAKSAVVRGFSSGKTWIAGKVAGKLNKTALAGFVTKLSPVLNVAGLGSVVYMMADGFSIRASEPEQAQQLVQAANNLASSDLYLDYSRSVANVLDSVTKSHEEKITATSEASRLLSESDSRLGEFREMLPGLTPLQFIFAAAVLNPGVTVPAIDNLLSNDGVPNLSKAILSTSLAFVEMAGYLDSEGNQSSEIESQLFDGTHSGSLSINAPVSAGVVDVQREGMALLESKLDAIKTLERLTGLHGSYQGEPALATFLELIATVSAKDVRLYYELKQLVR